MKQIITQTCILAQCIVSYISSEAHPFTLKSAENIEM